MEEVEKVLQRIGTLKNRVDCLIQKEENLLTINKSIIQKLKNVKEMISTTILNIKTNIIDSIHYKQTKENIQIVNHVFKIKHTVMVLLGVYFLPLNVM